MQIGLLRHAKSSWNDARLEDHDRPLSPRGERAAALMGVFIAQSGSHPDLVLCSSARRARETWQRVEVCLPGSPEVRVERDLYLASAGDLLERIRAISDAMTSVLLIGHNPGIGLLAVELAGSGDASLRRHLASKFPTAAFALLRLPGTSWHSVAPATGELLAFRTPKELV